MSREAAVLKTAVFALLGTHALWLVAHMWLVAHERINPWKLGGYGMYTVPSPGLQVFVSDNSFGGAPMPLMQGTYTLAGFGKAQRATNPERVFRCRHPGVAEFLAFFAENPGYRGTNLVFDYVERRMTRNPVEVKRVQQGRVTVQWKGRDAFTITSEFCGDKKVESAPMP